jgi:hypothetical protein
MTFQLYLVCFAVALVGMALHTALKMKGLQDKARLANVEFKPSSYFKQDWLSLTASFLTIILFLLFIDNILKWKPAVIDFVKIGMAFVGYTGSDLASRIFGVVNKKINLAIDHKTTMADKETGDLEAPTPLPEKKSTQV